jgi:enamine deaminase RidA (YjgF/YER057c/UK114 family)
MGKIEDRLAELGEKLPVPHSPVANYLPCKRSGSTLYVSGKISDLRGEVGTEVSLEQAYQAAKDTVLVMLAMVKGEIGDLDLIVSVDYLCGFVRGAPTFLEHPKVINGASDLLVALFGEAGRHARTATGVAMTPFGASVQLEMILRLRD